MDLLKTAATTAAALLSLPAASGVTIELNFDYDTGGFFSGPAGSDGATARAALQAAADHYSAILIDDLAAIDSDPTLNNNYEISFGHPSQGGQVTIPFADIPADTMRIYVGARFLGTQPGFAGSGSASISGSTAFVAAAESRGEDLSAGPEVTSWGGFATFNNRSGRPFWGFDHSAAPRTSYFDLYSVALHEFGHALGFGTSDAFSQLIDTSSGSPVFVGDRARYFNGGTDVPLEGDQQHIGGAALDTEPHPYSLGAPSGLQEASLLRSIGRSERRHLTLLDTAILDDIGWDVNYLVAVPEPSAALLALAGTALLATRRRRA